MPTSPFSFVASPMTGVQLMLKQRIPFPGSKRAAARLARAVARLPRFNLAALRLELAHHVSRRVVSVAFVDRAIAIAVAHVAILDRMLAVATARLKVGKATLPIVLKARVARARMFVGIEKLRLERRTFEAHLNALTARPQSTAIGPVPLPNPGRPPGPLAALIAQAGRRRPELARTTQRRRVARLRGRVARYGLYPKLSAMVGWRFRGAAGMDPVKGADFWTVGVGMTVPLFSRGRAEARVLSATLAGVRASRAGDRVRLMIARQVRLARDGMISALRRHRLYTGRVVPRAREALRASLDAYSLGRMSFIALLDHQRTLYRQELARDRQLALFGLYSADLARATGARTW